MQADGAAPPATPSSEPRAGARTAIAWIIGAFLLRTLLAGLTPLLPDETYYWEWTRHLAGGYFDHPPAIAFLIRLGTLVFGDTALGIRAGPAVVALVTHAAAAYLAWQCAGRGAAGANAAARAAAVVALLPLATVGLVLATPDAALFATSTVALLAVERALAAPVRSRRSTAWWLAAGVALGFAFLSKYTAVLLPAGLTLACIAYAPLRARLREPGPWLASVVALLLFAPVVLWNRNMDWISFRFQLSHGFQRVTKASGFSRELELVGGQLGLASPVLFVLLAAATVGALRAGWRMRGSALPTDPAVRRFALAVVASVPMLFFAVSAWKRSVEPNWPALAYPGAIALLATSPAAWARGRAWRAGVSLAAVLLAVVTLQVWKPLLVTGRRDPIARAYGWSTLAASVDEALRDGFLDGTRVRWAAADRYQDASELAFHLPAQPTVFSLNLGGRANQYDLWPTTFERLQPTDGLVVAFDANDHGDELAARVSTWFADTKRGPTVALTRDGQEVAHRRIWLYRFARNLPPPTRAGAAATAAPRP